MDSQVVRRERQFCAKAFYILTSNYFLIIIFYGGIGFSKKMLVAKEDVEMTEFECNIGSYRCFLYRKKPFVFTVLYKLYNY